MLKAGDVNGEVPVVSLPTSRLQFLCRQLKVINIATVDSDDNASMHVTKFWKFNHSLCEFHKNQQL